MFQFVGNIEAKMDAKNRVFLPVAFRKPLLANSQTTLILRKDIFRNCLVLYPEEVWNQELASLKQKLNRWIDSERQLLRQFVVDAERIEMDTNGRILISKRCQEMTGLENDITFVGVDDTIELWSREELSNSLLPAEDFGKMLENIMSR